MDYNDRPLHEKIAEATAVWKRFPDAIERNDRYSEFSYYRSKSIAKDPDLSFDYSGVWQNLSVRPYVMVPFTHYGEANDIRVGGVPSYYSVVNLEWPTELGNSGTKCVWGNFEMFMLDAGFTQQHIIAIYKQYLTELTKNPAPEIELVKETLPSYIRNLMPFI